MSLTHRRSSSLCHNRAPQSCRALAGGGSSPLIRLRGEPWGSPEPPCLVLDVTHPTRERFDLTERTFNDRTRRQRQRRLRATNSINIARAKSVAEVRISWSTGHSPYVTKSDGEVDENKNERGGAWRLRQKPSCMLWWVRRLCERHKRTRKIHQHPR